MKGKSMKSKTRLTKIVSTSLLAVGLLGVTAFSRNPNRTMADRGTVASVNAKESTLTITEAKSHQPQVFTWNSDTRFLERGDHLWSKSKAVMADQLQPGEPVKIRYQKENDQLLAKMIVISHPNKAAASASRSNS
jgi:hypothetical protein